MGKSSKQSPAVTLIRHVYDHQGERLGRSRERFHDGVRSAARVAISFGLHFDIDDAKFLASQRTPSYHDTSIYTPDEHDYALACGKERGRANPSFCLSFEKWRDRKPFLIRQPDEKTPTRLYVGRDFIWYGERVSLTSFAEDQSYAITCTYKPGCHTEGGLKVGSLLSVENWKRRKIEAISGDGLTLTLGADLLDYGDFDHERKIERRLKITHADIKDYHASLTLLTDFTERANKMPPHQLDAMRSRITEKFGKEKKPDRYTLPELKLVKEWLDELPATDKAAPEPELVPA